MSRRQIVALPQLISLPVLTPQIIMFTLDNGKAGGAALFVPAEIWDVILESVTHSTLASLCIVNRYLYDVTIPHLYREPFLPGTGENTWRQICRSVRANPNLADMVRVYVSPSCRDSIRLHSEQQEMLLLLRNLTSAFLWEVLVVACPSKDLRILEVDLDGAGRTMLSNMDSFCNWLGTLTKLERLSFLRFPRGYWPACMSTTALLKLKHLACNRDALRSLVIPGSRLKGLHAFGAMVEDSLERTFGSAFPLSQLARISLELPIRVIPTLLDLLRLHSSTITDISIALPELNHTWNPVVRSGL